MNDIAALVLSRVAGSAVTLFLVSAILFSAGTLLPSDAAQEALGQGATPETVAALRVQLGLDQPAHLRYLHWLTGMLSGDPGVSLANDRPVSELIRNRLPKSLVLASLACAISVPLALSLGIFSAVCWGTRLERVVNILTLAMVAIPEFLVATVCVIVFSVRLHWLPALASPPEEISVHAVLRAYTLPVLTLCFAITAQMARLTRAALVSELGQAYVEMALLKGLRMSRVVLVHALPNAVGPIANAVALSLSYLLGGAIIVETIFNYPGIASLMVDAVTTRDMPLLMTCAMIFCSAYVALMLVADIFSIVSNPKLRSK